MNRLTITLPDDLYAMARAYAVSRKLSLSRAIGDLLRQRSAGPELTPTPGGDTGANSYFDPVLGIQVSRCDKPLTEDDIRRSLDNEDVRHLEMMGLRDGKAARTHAQ